MKQSLHKIPMEELINVFHSLTHFNISNIIIFLFIHLFLIDTQTHTQILEHRRIVSTNAIIYRYNWYQSRNNWRWVRYFSFFFFFFHQCICRWSMKYIQQKPVDEFHLTVTTSRCGINQSCNPTINHCVNSYDEYSYDRKKIDQNLYGRPKFRQPVRLIQLK